MYSDNEDFLDTDIDDFISFALSEECFLANEENLLDEFNCDDLGDEEVEERMDENVKYNLSPYFDPINGYTDPRSNQNNHFQQGFNGRTHYGQDRVHFAQPLTNNVISPLGGQHVRNFPSSFNHQPFQQQTEQRPDFGKSRYDGQGYKTLHPPSQSYQQKRKRDVCISENNNLPPPGTFRVHHRQSHVKYLDSYGERHHFTFRNDTQSNLGGHLRRIGQPGIIYENTTDCVTILTIPLPQRIYSVNDIFIQFEVERCFRHTGIKIGKVKVQAESKERLYEGFNSMNVFKPSCYISRNPNIEQLLNNTPSDRFSYIQISYILNGIRKTGLRKKGINRFRVKINLKKSFNNNNCRPLVEAEYFFKCDNRKEQGSSIILNKYSKFIDMKIKKQKVQWNNYNHERHQQQQQQNFFGSSVFDDEYIMPIHTSKIIFPTKTTRTTTEEEESDGDSRLKMMKSKLLYMSMKIPELSNEIEGMKKDDVILTKKEEQYKKMTILFRLVHKKMKKEKNRD